MKCNYTSIEIERLYRVKAKTIQYYANNGIIVPSVSTGNGRGSNRLYSKDDIDKIQLIPRLQKIGYQLNRIKQILKQPAHWIDDKVTRVEHLKECLDEV